MSWIDFVIVGVVFVSCFISLIRGFVREALSLASWVISFLLAWNLHSSFASFFQTSIDTSNLRLIVAFFTLFILSLVMFTVVNYFASKMVQRTGLTGVDRVIGVIFGFLRGVLLITAMVALAGLTHLPSTPQWKASVFLGQFQSIAVWLTGLLPAEVAKNFAF